MHEFIYGKYKYSYALIRQERKTLSLTVRPDLSIVVKCPIGASQSRTEDLLKRKWSWLEKQLAYFKKFQKTKGAKEYVSGESFLYLGRQYQLLVRRAAVDKVVLQKGKLVFYSSLSENNKNYTKRFVDQWYKNRTREIFEERFLAMYNKFGYAKMPRLKIQKLEKKWGSCFKGKVITLNPLLIQAPKNCIDYVITHELCHLQYKNHDKRFYALLDAKFPKWEKVKEMLEMRFI